MAPRVLITSYLPAAVAWAESALGEAFEPEPEPSVQELGSQLFRDPDAMGLLITMGPASAAEHVRRMRQAEVRNLIMSIVVDEGLSRVNGVDQSVAGRVMVLMAGADDCQPWPIDDRELVARLKALRTRGKYFDHLAFPMPGGCEYRYDRARIASPRGDVHLSKTLERLLVLLARSTDRHVTKQEIMDGLYDGMNEPEIKIVDVLVCKLRKLIIKATGGIDCVETVWGQGYRWVHEGFEPTVIPMRDRNARRRAVV